MGNLIYLVYHPTTKRIRDEIGLKDDLIEHCALKNGDYTFPACCGFPDECEDCVVIKYEKTIKNKFIKLIYEGHL